MQHYWIQVFDEAGRIEGEASIHCEDDRAAVRLAAATASPFGHQLRSTHGFLGRFEIGLTQGGAE